MPRTNPSNINLPLVDAGSIQGVPISDAAPTDGQALVFNTSTGQYEPGTVSGSGGGGGGDPGAQYLTLAATASLSAERVFTPGTGLKGADGGAGSAYTLSVNDGVVATLSGSKFSGPVTASLGISGSFASFGTGYTATTGQVRLANNGGIYFRSYANNTDLPLAVSDTGNSILIGDNFINNAYVAAANTAGLRGGAVAFQGATGTPTYATISPTTAIFSVPLTASLGVSGSHGSFGTSPVATTGSLRIAKDLTLKARNYNDTANLTVMQIVPSAAPELYFGANNAYGEALQYVYVAAGGGVYFNTNGTSRGRFDGNGLTVDNAANIYTSAATFSVPVTCSSGMHVKGNGQITIGHSGSTVREYDAFHRVHELEERISTTNATPATVCSFLSGANGRSYAVDVSLMAQHTSTIECAHWKLSGHYRRTGGTMTLMRIDTALSSSNVAALSGTLTISGGNIIVQGTGTSTGSFRWGCSMRVQEIGT